MPDGQHCAVLYVLPRMDLASMTADMTVLQAMRAVVHAISALERKGTHGPEWRESFVNWTTQTDGGHGVTRILWLENLTRLREVTGILAEAGYPAGLVTDPAYPVIDGAFTHSVTAVTCGWIFGAAADLEEALTNIGAGQPAGGA
jgi:hypothetical protein